MQPTFDQAFQLLNITRESGASLETLQAVYGAGLLSDLLKAENPCKVNREEFRKLLGYDPSVFKVKMGGANNTDEITAALGFPFNGWITQANFPLTASETPTGDEIEIVDPSKSFSEEEGLQILKRRSASPDVRSRDSLRRAAWESDDFRKEAVRDLPARAWQTRTATVASCACAVAPRTAGSAWAFPTSGSTTTASSLASARASSPQALSPSGFLTLSPFARSDFGTGISFLFEHYYMS